MQSCENQWDPLHQHAKRCEERSAYFFGMAGGGRRKLDFQIFEDLHSEEKNQRIAHEIIGGKQSDTKRSCSRTSIDLPVTGTCGDSDEDCGEGAALPDVCADDDDGDDGDDDPDPEPRRQSITVRSTCAKAGRPARSASVLDALTNFDALPDVACVRLPVVCALFACSPATAWRLSKSGTIPKPVKLSERVTAWRVGEVRAALNALQVQEERS